jgi:hypothetical protein
MSDDLVEIDLNLDEDRENGPFPAESEDEAFDDTRLIQDDGGDEEDEVSAKIDWKTVIPLGVLQFVERWNSDSIYAFVSWLGEGFSVWDIIFLCFSDNSSFNQ